MLENFHPIIRSTRNLISTAQFPRSMFVQINSILNTLKKDSKTAAIMDWLEKKDIENEQQRYENLNVAMEIINRAVSAMPQTHGKEYNTNVVYQSLTNAEPKDAMEATLCAQSVALYAQGMQYLAQAGKTEVLYQAEFSIKCAIKLLRLNNETTEALARYRRKGEQKVVVQHVNVNDGGKAIVGNMIS